MTFPQHHIVVPRNSELPRFTGWSYGDREIVRTSDDMLYSSPSPAPWTKPVYTSSVAIRLICDRCAGTGIVALDPLIRQRYAHAEIGICPHCVGAGLAWLRCRGAAGQPWEIVEIDNLIAARLDMEARQ